LESGDRRKEEGAWLGGSMELAMGGLQEGARAAALSMLPPWLLYVRRRKEKERRK
jgi:hypothetical protein